MAITRNTEKKGTAIERMNINMDGVYLGNITLWDDSNVGTVGMFNALKQGANINGLTATNPVTGGKTAEEITNELLAKYTKQPA